MKRERNYLSTTRTSQFAIQYGGKLVIATLVIFLLGMGTCAQSAAAHQDKTPLALPECENCTKPQPPHKYAPAKPYLKIPQWPAERGDWG
jgi:hypothetical protein